MCLKNLFQPLCKGLGWDLGGDKWGSIYALSRFSSPACTPRVHLVAAACMEGSTLVAGLHKHENEAWGLAAPWNVPRRMVSKYKI